MKKIIVSADLCIGCGACIAIDPEHFAFNDEGLSVVTSNENLESPTLKEGMEACPTNAITFGEEDTCDNENCNCNPCECPEGECHCEDEQ